MIRASLFSAVAVIALGACTHLETTRDYTSNDTGKAVVGIPYALPALQYDLKTTSNLEACSIELAIGERRFSDGAFSLSTKVEATRNYVAGERFVADYRSLASFLKTSSYSLETYPSGVLKSINAAAEDQTAPFLRDVIAVGLTLSGLPGDVSRITPMSANSYGESGGRPLNFDADLDRLFAGAPEGAVLCTESAAAKIAKRDALANTLKTENGTLKDATALVDRLTIIAANKRATHADLTDLKLALAAQSAAQRTVELAKKTHDKAAGEFLVASQVRWPQAVTGPSDALIATIELPPEDRAAILSNLSVRAVPIITKSRFAQWWLSVSEPTKDYFVAAYPAVASHFGLSGSTQIVEITEDSPLVCKDRTLEECLDSSLRMTGAIALADRPAAASGGAPAPTASQSQPGLFIRTQQKADFTLCPGRSANCAKSSQLFVDRNVSAPQFGQLRFLPFSNGPFEAAKLSLAMREDGSVEKFEYSRSKAAGTEAAAAAKDAVSQYSAFLEKQQKRETDAIAAARAEEIAVLQHRISLLTKEDELDKLLQPNEPDLLKPVRAETAAIEAEVALLNARLAKLKAEAALASGGGD